MQQSTKAAQTYCEKFSPWQWAVNDSKWELFAFLKSAKQSIIEPINIVQQVAC